MTKSYTPFGPFYLTLVCESPFGETVDTALIDGFEDEADAWRACENLSSGKISALNDNGEEIEIDGGAILHVAIVKSSLHQLAKTTKAA